MICFFYQKSSVLHKKLCKQWLVGCETSYRRKPVSLRYRLRLIHNSDPAGATRHPFFGKEGDGTATKPTETPIFIGVTIYCPLTTKKTGINPVLFIHATNP